jgi:hypothetical protein
MSYRTLCSIIYHSVIIIVSVKRGGPTQVYLKLHIVLDTTKLNWNTDLILGLKL